MVDVAIRKMAPWDIPQTLKLMRDLADFEDYADNFRVTELDLLFRSQGEEPQFFCFVAVGENNTVLGYAVMLLTHFTHDLVPTATLKELFVAEGIRGNSVGEKLFNAVVNECQFRGITRLNWTVMRGNVDAEHFYQKQGGQPSKKWLLYERVIKPTS